MGKGTLDGSKLRQTMNASAGQRFLRAVTPTLTAATRPTASRLADPNSSFSSPDPLRGTSDLFLCIKFRESIAAGGPIQVGEEQLQLRFQHGGLGVKWGEEYLEDEGSTWCKQGQ